MYGAMYKVNRVKVGSLWSWQTFSSGAPYSGYLGFFKPTTTGFAFAIGATNYVNTWGSQITSVPAPTASLTLTNGTLYLYDGNLTAAAGTPINCTLPGTDSY